MCRSKHKRKDEKRLKIRREQIKTLNFQNGQSCLELNHKNQSGLAVSVLKPLKQTVCLRQSGDGHVPLVFPAARCFHHRASCLSAVSLVASQACASQESAERFTIQRHYRGVLGQLVGMVWVDWFLEISEEIDEKLKHVQYLHS